VDGLFLFAAVPALSVSRPFLRGFLNNFYLLVALLAAGVGAVGYIALRWRNPPVADQVSPSVLDRIRTEYR
jgi:hypothetical protein